MLRINIQEIIEQKTSLKLSKYPKIIQKIIILIISFILKAKELENTYNLLINKKNIDFIDELFEYLDFSYNLSNKDKLRIPSEGKLICISNHPLGALDGLALLKTIYEVRQDVKIVANDILMTLDNLKDLFLSYDVFSLKTQKENIVSIENALLNDEAVIFFPAGEVSRFSLRGIKDRLWQKGALRFARKLKSPILPIYIKGRNSIFFYVVSFLFHKISAILLPREIFLKKGSSITIKIGDPIPYSSINTDFLNIKQQNKILQKHVNKIGKKNKGIIKTEKNIIHPVSRKQIKFELAKSEKLGMTSDGKKMYLVNGKKCNHTLKEISRLREITFRKVGEGTGNKCDNDTYDDYYSHLVLWDDENLDIVGSYRLGICCDIINKYGVQDIYNSELFLFSESFLPVLMQSLELGRSFVQQKYWKSQALDYIWQGVAALLLQKKDIRYLFGSVSISNTYSDFAKALIVGFYKKWHSDTSDFVTAKNKFIVSKNVEDEISLVLSSNDYDKDFKNLKNVLKNLGYTVPVLLRKYSELCEKEGVKFLDFGIDKSFSNSIDCFICLDLYYLKESKKERYYYQNKIVNSSVQKLEV